MKKILQLIFCLKICSLVTLEAQSDFHFFTEKCELSQVELYWSFSDTMIVVSEKGGKESTLIVDFFYACCENSISYLFCYETVLGTYQLLYNKYTSENVLIINAQIGTHKAYPIKND